MLKRICTGIVWGVTMLAFLSLLFLKGATAEGDLSLSIDSVSMLHPGDQATVSVHLVNPTAGVNMLQFVVEYEQEELELISTNKGSIFASVGAPVINDQIPGVIFVNWEGDRTITSDCILLEMVFSPATSATIDSIVRVSKTQELIVSNWETEFEPSLTNGTIHIEKEIAAINVTDMPSKTVYEEGDFFDSTGGKVTVTYDDGTMVEVSLTDGMVTGFDNTAVGPQTVTVTYGGVTTTFEVTVISRVSHSVVVSAGMTGGTVEADKASAFANDTVTLTVMPEIWHILDTLTAVYVDSENATQTLPLIPDANDGTKWTFVMPAYDVTVTAAFVSTTPDLELSPAEVSLYKGRTQQLTLQYADTHEAVTNAGSISWISSNENIQVDATGCVSLGTGATVGMTATITAVYRDKTVTAAVTVVTVPTDVYDAWISGVEGWLGSGYRVRFTVRVRNTVTDPTFEVRMGEDGENIQVDDIIGFKCSDWACWMFDGDPKPISGKDYTEYYILVKFFVRHLNTPALISIKDGSNDTVRIRSFQSSANGIVGVIGDSAGHSMVGFLDIKCKMNDDDTDYGELRDEMVIYCQKALKVNK